MRDCFFLLAEYLAIGIPTVQRQKDNYIVKTVTSLLDNMADTQRHEVVIIIMVADLDPARRNASLQQLESSFRDSISAGQVHVIAAPLHFYTDFKVTLAMVHSNTSLTLP